jgi:1,4-dihydroxy-2-naphthoate octaprenyltransferase
VPPALLPFSLMMKAIGWLLALLVNPLVFWMYGGFVGLSVAYSHPSVRWKARPIASLLVIAFGQGVLAFLGAWAANRGELASAMSWVGLLGAAAASLVVLGLYPLTQLFQVEEDRSRGDHTLAVAWGPAASFRVSLSSLVLGGTLLVLALLLRFGPLDAVLVGLGMCAELLAVLAWARQFDARLVMPNYRRVMRLNIASASALSLYLLFRLFNSAS